MTKPTYIMVDVEADGPCPGLYSMIEVGAVAVTPELDKTFYGQLAPITAEYKKAALAVTGYSRNETKLFATAGETMELFEQWLSQFERPMFVSDNNGFDWQFVNYYFWRFRGRNPFGHSSTNLGSLYKGKVRNLRKNFKHLRDTKHDHNPVNDAMGNAEAMLKVLQDFR